ncbi:MAG: cupin domain-containing protein [Synergistaceae bacterium]|nr:cupin domain-containing protein [Synergistaceae bacterium]
MRKNSRAEILKEAYNLAGHSEGGSFSEVYTAPDDKDGRSFAGSIYFLLDGGEISHFHQIDCDEIWYYHEGCGMKITVLDGKGKKEFLLGADVTRGERHMIVIPEGVIFAAENLREDGYTFVSCATTPKFRYEGFRLVGKNEIREKYPDIADEIEYLAY